MSDDECGCEQQHLLYNQVGSCILFSICKASQSWLWQATTRDARQWQGVVKTMRQVIGGKQKNKMHVEW